MSVADANQANQRAFGLSTEILGVQVIIIRVGVAGPA